MFVQYFDNSKEVLADVPANKILNFDETNLPDNPGAEKIFFKCG